MSSLRDLARLVRSTPLHPQWLLGRRQVPFSLRSAKGRILDVGAADRWIASHLGNDVDYVALDYPATGNQFYAARPDIFADACALPVTDAAVDGVVCLEVIEHVPDPGLAVREIARVLRPGGSAWISMPFLYPVHNEPFDFQRYTRYGLRRDAERAGLQVVELRRSGHALRAAGLMTCLAIAGGVNGCHPLLRILLLPLALLMICLVNVTCWALAACWPDWPNASMGHHAELRKPMAEGEGGVLTD
ncbi:class I SAM-dependent methyltransferase [Fulvimonas yonginensis]|uniref:Methyltransferase domain-containing protein n=1 Tax=Fulvimonas yonginensis TaxID=1495200 RepID=A0ABU8JD78_9GAMM